MFRDFHLLIFLFFFFIFWSVPVETDVWSVLGEADGWLLIAVPDGETIGSHLIAVPDREMNVGFFTAVDTVILSLLKMGL